jgi:hypothetical protein
MTVLFDLGPECGSTDDASGPAAASRRRLLPGLAMRFDTWFFTVF